MSKRPSIPAEIAREVLIESGHRCAVCGAGCPLERAHIISFHKAKEHKAKDLICLCANCHQRADLEKWGEKTLREHKRRPWVLRQYKNANSTPVPTTRVALTLQMELEHFDEKNQRWLQHAIAGFLAIPPDAVQVTSIEKSSVEVTIELPTQSVERLLNAYKRNDSELIKYLAPLVLLDIHRKEAECEETLEGLEGAQQIFQQSAHRYVEYYIRYVESYERDYSALGVENSNVLAALDLAFEQGMQRFLVRGANALYDFLEARGLYEIGEVHLNRAQQVARDLDDAVGRMKALFRLGIMVDRRGNYKRAEEFYQEGLALAHELGDRENANALLQGLGAIAVKRGNYEQAQSLYQEALAIAREVGDGERTSALLTNLGAVVEKKGNYDRAEELYQEALALAREIGDQERIAAPLQGLGVVAAKLGDYKRAGEFYKEALALAREIEHHRRASDLLYNLGTLVSRYGYCEQAEEYFQEALALAHETGYHENVIYSLASLGSVAIDRGDYDRAEEYSLEGLSLARGVEHREVTSYLLANLGLVAAKRGDHELAEEFYQEGLTLAREIGHPWLINHVLNEWGELHLKQQEFDSASAAFLEAVETARDVGHQAMVATALYGLARVMAAQGNIVEARRQGQEGLTILEAIGHSKATEIAQWLATLPTEDPSVDYQS